MAEQLNMEHLKLAVDNLDRRLTAVEEAERSEPWHNGPFAFLNRIDGSAGFVLDEAQARATPCRGIVFENGKRVVFSEGIQGPLDEAQQAVYCPEITDQPLSPAQRRRLEAFGAAAETCQTQMKPLPKGERLPNWLACMYRETKSRGVEL